MNFEEYLIEKRLGNLSPLEIAEKQKLITISNEIVKAKNLDDVIKQYGGVEYLTHPYEVEATLELMNKNAITGIDIETRKLEDHILAGLHPEVTAIRTVQLYQEGYPVIVIDCLKVGIDWLKGLNQFTKLYAHNALFELMHFKKVMHKLPRITCTMLLLRPLSGKNLSLVDSLVKVNDKVEEYASQDEEEEDDEDLAMDATPILGIKISKALQVSDWNREDLLKEQINYAGADAIAAWAIAKTYPTLIGGKSAKFELLENTLQELMYAVLDQSAITLDWEMHASLVKQWEAMAKESLELLELSGLENPKSTQQKQAWLQKHLTAQDMLDWPLTKTGKLATGKAVIKDKTEFSWLRPLSDYTKAMSLSANFGEKFRSLSINGRIFPNYQVAGMITGRFACRKPNLQQIPRDLKALVLAPKGYKLVAGDLSQIELRVGGLIAGEDVIRKAYENGEDLHTSMAMQITGKPVEEITKQDRQGGKAGNFGLIFGAGVARLVSYAKEAYGVEMSFEQAKEVKRAFTERYPRLVEWQQEAVNMANMEGLSASTYLGLTRYHQEEVYTVAMNHPIQSTAWEILALAILYVHEHKSEGIAIHHHVYDELCLIAREDKEDEAGLLLREAFKQAFLTIFPTESTAGLVGIGSGDNWEQAASDDTVRKEWSL